MPAGGLPVTLPSGDVVGTIYVYHYRGRSTSIEFNFTAGTEVLKRDAEVKRRFEDFLNRLAMVPAAHSAAETLRGSYPNRRPNVRLSQLSDEDVRNLVGALSRLCSE